MLQPGHSRTGITLDTPHARIVVLEERDQERTTVNKE